MIRCLHHAACGYRDVRLVVGLRGDDAVRRWRIVEQVLRAVLMSTALRLVLRVLSPSDPDDNRADQKDTEERHGSLDYA